MGTAEQAYFERNRKGFEGDSILRDKVKAIVKKHKIDLIIETGTYLGSTTKVMAEWVDQVITIESNIEYNKIIDSPSNNLILLESELKDKKIISRF